MSTEPRIAVFGTDANGGAIAASLMKTGADVVTVDPWVEHVEAIRDHGLTVRTADSKHTTEMTALHACELAGFGTRFDIVVLGVKAYDTRWACELLRPYLAADGTIVAVQNGITLDTVSDVFGQDRSVGAVIEVAANLMVPAHIEQQAPMWLALGGETPASQAHAERLASILSPAATTVVVDDIRSAKWMKLVANACELVPSAILDLPLADAITLPGMYEFMLQAGQEALQVALANDQHIVPIFGDGVDDSTLTEDNYVEHLLGVVLEDYTLPDTLTTVLQDWRKGRRAEIEELNGAVVGYSRGEIPCPANERILGAARQIEQGELQATAANTPHLFSQR